MGFVFFLATVGGLALICVVIWAIGGLYEWTAAVNADRKYLREQVQDLARNRALKWDLDKLDERLDALTAPRKGRK